MNAAVEIPANALAATTTITIEPIASPPAGNVGTAYEFGPDGTMFSVPVTIRLAYDPASLPAGVVEADLKLAKAVGGVWEVVPGSGPNTFDGEVRGETSSFSPYGLLPVVPGNLSAVAADGQITIDWDLVDEAFHYTIYWANHPTVSSGDFRISNVAPPYVHTGLTNGDTYYYRVASVNGIGEGSPSIQEVSATPEAAASPPAAPQNLRGCADDKTITLGWDAVDDATTYNLYGKQSAGVTTADIVDLVLDSPQYFHINLVNGAVWYYRVSAVNATGEGPLSAEISVPVTVLAAPQNVMAIAGVGQNTINWTPVDCAESYKIYWNTTGNVSSSDNEILVLDPDQDQYNHMGLVADTTYYYAMTTVNGLGESVLSTPEVSATPQEGATPVRLGAGSSRATCAAMSDGKLKCWGPRPGDGTGSSATPVEVPGINNATAVSLSNSHTCAIDGGNVKCWGAGTFGQLGDGTSTDSLTPVTVSNLSGVTDIAAGNGFTCAISSDTVYCWGTSPAVGNIDLIASTFAPVPTPLAVAEAPPADRVAVARDDPRACIVSNGEVWCWGTLPGYLGGDGGTVSENCNIFNYCNPTQSPIPDTGGFVANIALGQGSACFQLTNAIACVGGAKGFTFETLDTPLALGIMTAGQSFYCGTPVGAAYCWGWNGEGQLGNGTNTIQPYKTPVAVVGVGGATDIAAGYEHACAIDGGVVKCWGNYPGGPAPVIVNGL